MVGWRLPSLHAAHATFLLVVALVRALPCAHMGAHFPKTTHPCRLRACPPCPALRA